ncbi:MAG: exopolysaccharide biosynthesis polyprenyl glycosylphosphotransferase, partial [Acidimicrobiales bacterium]
TMVVFALATYTFLAGVSQLYSRAVFLTFWPLALASVPLGRGVARLVVARYFQWGELVAIIGPGKDCARLVERLVSRQALGLRPAVCFATTDGGQLPSTLVTAHSLDELARISREQGIRCAIIADGALVQTDSNSLDPYERLFPRTILVEERTGIDLSWVSTRDIGGMLGLETRNNLLSRWAQVQKRAIDIVLALIGLVIAAPFGALIAVAVKLDSPGPVFYTRLRVGKGGKHFKMLKFRSMHQDADKLFGVFLKENPGLLRQWQRYQKIRDDPRVTRVGKFLRKYSLDELPQFINVFKGDMSIVGPRPFLPEQEDEYGSAFRHYSRVSPGISGLWQVSGRNHATFSDRATLDERYVRNWSIWLDLYILAKTPWVVLARHGAY